MEPKTGEHESRAKAEANKEVVKRWFDALERGSVDEAVDCWAPDAVNHASGRYTPAPGPGHVRGLMQALSVAFPDRRWHVDDMIAEGEQVACRMTVCGTFGAPPQPRPGPLPAGYLGLESTMLVPASASGKPYSVKHIHVFRVADGVIAEHWAARDDLSLLLQLGAIAAPP